MSKPPYRIPLMSEIMAIPSCGLSVVSLFSGCGGSCLGFRMAGYRTIWASEFIPAAADTYRANFPEVPVDTRDIRSVLPGEILSACRLSEGSVGVEVSPPMLAAARERFSSLSERGVVVIRDDDLRESYPPVRASLTLCVLTLQFIPIEHRQRVLRDAFLSTVPGGAFVLVEKVLGATAVHDAAFVDLYYRLKAANGYTSEEIRRKRLSLEGVLVPVAAAWNEQLLRGAGFTEVDCFWRWMNFSGWIGIRPS